MPEKTLRKHQSLMDFAVQESGDVTALFELATLNGLSCTEIVSPGTSLIKPSIYNQAVVTNYTTDDIQPATLDDETNIPGGIGFMGIGINFKVS